MHELCATGDVVAVDAATLTYHHLTHSLQLAAGGKHLMIEKPVVEDVAKTEALILLQRESGVLVTAVDTCFRVAPIRATARVVQNRAIGRIPYELANRGERTSPQPERRPQRLCIGRDAGDGPNTDLPCGRTTTSPLR